jgi:hypothetical protein
MPSRPVFDDANQLRRTKSSHTVIQRRSSASSLIDPVAAKQHAIVAATLAYERAHSSDINSGHGAKVARCRSNRARRSEGEGSHFDASHTPRQRTSKRVSNASHVTNDNSRTRRSTVSSGATALRHENRPRGNSELQDYTTRHVDDSTVGSSSTPFKPIRRSKSLYNPSSNVRATSIDAISFARTPLQASRLHTTDESMASIQDQHERLSEDIPPVPPITISQTAVYNVDDKLQKARDEYFQALHRKKIRHRASFILTPFKKRNESVLLSSTTGNGVTFDNAPPPPVAVVSKEERKVSNETKAGGSLKSKIRKVFRRNSTAISVLPAQHVEASRAHYNNALAEWPAPPLRQAPGAKGVNISPLASAGDSRPSSPVRSVNTTESRSRVTSWADSTIAGTVASHESRGLAIIHEDAPHPTASSRRKFSSLGIFRRSPKSSSTTLSKCPVPPTECETLNDDPFHESTSQAVQAGLKRGGAAYETLPSQSRRVSANSSRASFSMRPTIRPVPSDSGGNLSSRSCSSRLASTSTNHLIRHDEGSSEEAESTNEYPAKRLRNRLTKARKEEPIKPTVEQIAHRVERSNDRWKQPLEVGRSIFYPRSPQGASTERHSRPSGQLESSPEMDTPPLENTLNPVQELALTRTMGAISPSIYSQNTNSSPQRKPYDSAVSLETDRHAVVVGTAVINPSQLAGKYPVGSPTKRRITPQLAKTSRDWKDWLSKEVQEFEGQSTESFQLRNDYIQPPVRSGHQREHAQIVDGEDVTVGAGQTVVSRSVLVPSIDPFPIPRPRQTSSEEPSSTRYPIQPPSRPSSRPRLEHPRLVDRPSSRMNERFPFIETKRSPSRAARGPLPKSTPPSESSPPVLKKEDTNSSSMLAVPVPQPRRPLRRPMSTSSFQRSNSSLAQYTTNTSFTANNSSINQLHRSTSHVPRTSASASASGTINVVNGNTHLPNRSTSALSSSRPALSKTMTTPLTLAGPNVDTDPTLAAIFKGPYRENSASPALPPVVSVRKVPSLPQSIREQLTPQITTQSSSRLPRESLLISGTSSSSILRDGRMPQMLKATSSLSLKENCSPTRSVRDDGRESAGSTPTRGQILAERFLEARGYVGVGSVGDSSPTSPRFI